jgi:hypothetical protein
MCRKHTKNSVGFTGKVRAEEGKISGRNDD